ncbi:Protein kinase domain-containing protein [Fusarium sp. Ph1]|nr:Protein kinase domain-containing protein [Fusarium sp. Ph1]
MAFLKPLFRFSPGVIWDLLKRVYLFIQPFSMIAMGLMSRFFPGVLMEADRTTRMKFITELEKACSQSALAPANSFLPEGKVPSLVTTETVKRLMPRASDDLVEFVCIHAKKVFLTTLLSRHDTIHAAMSSFCEHRIMDNALPIQALTRACDVCELPTEGECHHKTEWPCFQSWECCEISNFQKSQWVFCAPVFMENDSLLRLEESHVLPFTSVDEIGTGGHFSTVSRAKIHPDHYRGYASSNKDASGQVHVALKHMKDLREPGYNVQTAWASEAGALDQINQLHNKHLIRRTGAFRTGKNYYIMFEWADGGTLRDVWERQNVDHTTLNGTRIMQVLEQLHGLAEALSKLHNTVNTKQLNGDTPGPLPRAETILAPPSLNVPKVKLQVDSDNSDNTGEEHWRHGDLKPDNILLFKDATSPWLGTLKIADLGLAKQHAFATSQRVDPTRQKYSTSHYEAPEVVIRRHEPRSRLYDIWSMGCIIFEFVIWLLYGYPGLQRFYGEKPPTSRDTLYFTVNPREDHAQVSDIVKKWMEYMQRFDPECNDQSPSVIGDLIKLVKNHLLVVTLPGQMGQGRTRQSAEFLERSLREIMNKAVTNRGGTYLFTRSSRKAAQALKEMSSLSTGSGGQAMALKSPNLFDNVWEFQDDSSFATSFLHKQDTQLSRPFPPQPVLLCERCARLSLLTDIILLNDIFANIRKLSEKCHLHRLILDGLKGYHETSLIEVRRVGCTLKLNGKPMSGLSICKGLAENTRLYPATDSLRNIKIGLPQLPEVNSSPFYDLMLHWVQDCDSNHPECRPLNHDPECLPTRLLDVGPSGRLGNYSLVHLLVTRRDLDTGHDLRYIALSHPWGGTLQNDHFCTTPENFHQRLIGGIPFDTLPLTFKNAVQVTRSLNIRYLWIDSLCIVQGDGGDFDTEAKNMETIFSSAYCVIAASRASGTSSGFLGERGARNFIRFDGATGSPHYICKAIDDFQHDVIEGDLNKRGWVLQERALARRTIYFTKNQTYWECGKGIRCETLARMTNTKVAFLGDPNFPNLAIDSTKGTRIRFYEELYEGYSRLHFTKAYDRPIAIAGLEQRLVNAFETHGGYGVFQGEFFGRSLLWIRDARFTDKLKEIDFPSSQKYAVPTWSWMAYQGAITFMNVPFDEVDWEEGKDAIKSPWTWNDSSSSSATWHTGNSNENIDLTAYARDLVSPGSAEKGIVFDQGRTGLTDGTLKCVVVGKEKVRDEKADVALLRHYYVLLVVPRRSLETGYERVGAACLPGTCISWDSEVRVRIF